MGRESVGAPLLYRSGRRNDFIRFPACERVPLRSMLELLDCAAFGRPFAAVHLTRAKNVRSILPHLKDLNTVSKLFILKSDLTDADLDDVAALHSLETLTIVGSPITDDGLRRIRGMSSLKDVCLCGSSVTDTGLRCLDAMPQLKGLDLTNCKGIDGSGLTYISALKNLEDLGLNGTRVSNGELQYLGGLPKLHSIAVEYSRVEPKRCFVLARPTSFP